MGSKREDEVTSFLLTFIHEGLEHPAGYPSYLHCASIILSKKFELGNLHLLLELWPNASLVKVAERKTPSGRLCFLK